MNKRTKLSIAIVYFKDPFEDYTGMDIIRWHELSRGFHSLGHNVDMVSPQCSTTMIKKNLWVRNISEVNWAHYDVVITSSHKDIRLVKDHEFIISRIGRVIDEYKPSREYASRKERLSCQAEIYQRARFVSFTCQENLIRWKEQYSGGPACLIVPTGCPVEIPKLKSNPYLTSKNVLYLGSLTSSRFVERLNKLGRILKSQGVTLHFLGRNNLDLYGETQEQLDPRWVNIIGCLPEAKTWDYVFFANVGIALARGPDIFDNEISKIYYYLRAGLPVVSEQFIANNYLLDKTKLGEVAKYDDIDDMVEKIKRWLNCSSLRHKQAVQKYMKAHHSWMCRVTIYDEIILKQFVTNEVPYTR